MPSKKFKPTKRLPTKDEVLEFIEENEGHTSRRDIARAFNIRGDDRIELKRILRELTDEGAIDRPKGKIEQLGRLTGTMVLDIIDTDTDGDLIASPVNWQGKDAPPRIRLAPGRIQIKPALGVGERVLAKVRDDEDGAYVAVVEKRLGASAHEILGVVKRSREGPRIEPVDRRVRGELHVALADLKGAEVGDLVLCTLLPDRGHGPKRARIKDRLGNMDAPQAISLIAIHSHHLPVNFPEGAVDEAEAAQPAPLGAREDLRRIPLITIDPEDARDHDDAVYAEDDTDARNPGGFILWVAIADVAHYVTPGSSLDRAAVRRGNSVYFPDRVVPMLPEALSADMCSLRQGEERACLAIRIIIDAHGEKKGARLVRGLMKSAARLTYAQAQAAWDGRPDEATRPILDSVLGPLFAAYDTLKIARERRSPLDLDLPEHGIAFGPDGKVASVKRRERLETMRMIEEFMVLANVAAAELLETKRTPLLYRVHESPDSEKLRAFQEFVESLGFRFPLGENIRSRNFNRLIVAARGTDFEQMLHEVVLRTQSQARYAPDRLGHFGLSLRSYAHFTSPIRRYSDLVVHRALIKAYDLGDDGLTDAEAKSLGEIGEQVSNLERRAMAAERDASDRYLAAYLSDRIGAEFHGRISGVTRFGLFVRLSETGADGIIPIRTLGNDYFIHDERAHALIGEVSGATFRLGEPIEVRLVEAAPITGGLVFELLSEPLTYSKRSKAPKTARAAKRRNKGK